jgi:hypothetical protein
MAAEVRFVIPRAFIEQGLLSDDRVQTSLESFLEQWKGKTVNNDKRAKTLGENLGGFKDTVAFLNPHGDGCCFYQAIFMFLKLVQPAIPYRDHMHLRSELLARMYRKISTEYGVPEKDVPEFAEEMGILDPNCPALELALSTFCELHGLCAAVIQHPREPPTLKFGNIAQATDFLTLFVNEGHVYLVFPYGSRSPSVRQVMFNGISGGAGGGRRRRRSRVRRRSKKSLRRSKKYF